MQLNLHFRAVITADLSVSVYEQCIQGMATLL